MESAEEREWQPLKTGFDWAWRGWQPSQVRAYLDRVEADVQVLVTDRDAAAARVDELRQQLTETREQLTALQQDWDRACSSPVDPEALDERLRRKVELAERAAEEILGGARAAAGRRWEEASHAADSLEACYQDLIEQAHHHRRDAENAYYAVVDRTQAEVDEITRRTEAERAQLDETAARRREQLALHFEAEMQQRRDEEARRAAEREAATEAEAQRVLREATQQAGQLVARAGAQADVLRRLRHDIAGQLQSAYELLRKVEPFGQQGNDTVPAQGRLQPDVRSVPEQVE